ncbi:putative leader peptide [Actinomycetospora atypica]|uniref:Leader peptide n=1 Tax=Actinomycetospora atypica TaxID=1290095 RepID=A0ABV9YRP0_9PSEU
MGHPQLLLSRPPGGFRVGSPAVFLTRRRHVDLCRLASAVCPAR